MSITNSFSSLTVELRNCFLLSRHPKLPQPMLLPEQVLYAIEQICANIIHHLQNRTSTKSESKIIFPHEFLKYISYIEFYKSSFWIPDEISKVHEYYGLPNSIYRYLPPNYSKQGRKTHMISKNKYTCYQREIRGRALWIHKGSEREQEKSRKIWYDPGK